jgi:hypothetical protein
MTRTRISIGVVLMIALGVGVALLWQPLSGAMGTASAAYEQGQRAGRIDRDYLQFDVAEDPTKFVFDDAPVFEEDGFPAYGNPFITQGYIYPYGTLDDSTGVIIDPETGEAHPEFPDLVLGTWFCRGWFIGDGAHTTEGPVVLTHQIYQFGDEYGSMTFTTDGFERADDLPINRAITGGTGPFGKARGDVTQQLLRMTDDMGVNLRFEVNLNN